MKRKLLFLMLFAAFTGLNAQIVNIPDSYFKSGLLALPGIDANNDGEIQVSEAEAVTYLDLEDFPLISMWGAQSLEGLQAFVNLEYFHMYEMDVLSYIPPLSALTSLETFYATSSCVQVDLDFTNCTSLETIIINWMSINSVNVNGCTNLKHFKASLATFDTLDLTTNPQLQTIDIHNNSSWDQGVAVTFGYMPELTDVTFSNPVITDLTTCPAIENLHIGNSVNAGITYIKLKNGNINYSSIELELDGVENPIYICIDEGEEASLPDNVLNNPNIFITTYCMMGEGDSQNHLSGNLYYDADGNGCVAENSFAGYTKFNITGTEAGTVYASAGNYTMHAPAGTYTITPELENDWFTVSPASATETFANNFTGNVENNFCFTPNGVHTDAGILISSGGAQPGFDTDYTVTFFNQGNQTLSGTITLNYDDVLLDFVSATGGGNDAGGTVSWSYSNLLPLESRTFQLTFNVNSPQETPAVNIGDILNFTASVSPTTGDETPADNTFVLNETVTGSFDPNDITCLEGESVAPDMIGEYLHYNINFENTGSAPATFIAVKDIIDEEMFDLNTLQLLYASHDVETRITGNKVEFYFGDINLAADGGKGNVMFKIKSKNTLQVNDNVAQQADIFFDYNLPITTNEAVTTFEVLSNDIFTKDNSVTVSPNPSSGIVNITANTAVTAVELYDMQGRLLQVTQQSTLDVSSKQSGIYFVKVTTESGSKVQKLVKK